MNQETQTHLRRLNRALLVAFALVAASLTVWSVLRSPTLAARDDNPRLVEAALRVQRGRILDRNNVLLAHSTTTESGQADRVYPIVNIGPAVGYYSFRHGTAGIEAGYDDVLGGGERDAWQQLQNQLLHEAPQGRDVRLTLDAEWQRRAEAQFGNHLGALILLHLTSPTTTTAQIVAMVSHPQYDPNVLDEEFEALVVDEQSPLLNRVTQGQYQPGLVLQPFLLAAAEEQALIALTDPVETPDEPIRVNGQEKQCLSEPPPDATWQSVLQHRCPAPMQSLGSEFGRDGLADIFDTFGLTQPISLPLAVETAAAEPIVDPQLAAVGQDTLTVSPLQVARAWTALVTSGHLPTLQLVTAVASETGAMQTVTPTPQTAVALARPTAETLYQALPTEGSITEYSVLVLAGPDGTKNAWYLGTVTAGPQRFVVVLILEDVPDTAPAEAIGRRLLTAVAP